MEMRSGRTGKFLPSEEPSTCTMEKGFRHNFFFFRQASCARRHPFSADSQWTPPTQPAPISYVTDEPLGTAGLPHSQMPLADGRSPHRSASYFLQRSKSSRRVNTQNGRLPLYRSCRIPDGHPHGLDQPPTAPPENTLFICPKMPDRAG